MPAADAQLGRFLQVRGTVRAGTWTGRKTWPVAEPATSRPLAPAQNFSHLLNQQNLKMRSLAASKKRARAQVAEEQENKVAALRATFAARCDKMAWRSDWLPAGTFGGANIFLAHLGQSITQTVTDVSVATESARSQLLATRRALHKAIDVRCDELAKGLATAQTVKVAALARQHHELGIASHRWATEPGSVKQAASSLSDKDFTAQHAALGARLDGLEALLRALPMAPVDSSHIACVTDAPSLLASVAGFGLVVSPRGAAVVQPREALEAPHIAPAEPTPGNKSVAGVTAAAPPPSAPALPAAVVVAAAASSSAKVDGTSPADQLVDAVPAPRGMQAPLRLEGGISSTVCFPCITPTGVLLSPEAFAAKLHAYRADGSRLRSIAIAGLVATANICWVSYAEGPVPLLLAADMSRLVAVDPKTHALRWATAPASFEAVSGLAVLPRHGVAIVACSKSCSLLVHRLLDGVRLGSVECPENCFSVAADPATDTLYGGGIGVGFAVNAWVRTASSFQALSRVGAAGSASTLRLVVIMPPAPGKVHAHLIVGVHGESELRIISLPGGALIHKHVLRGMHPIGLAADPSGAALAVSDGTSDAIHVLRWPLPGMPLLV